MRGIVNQLSDLAFNKEYDFDFEIDDKRWQRLFGYDSVIILTRVLNSR